jgi:hypothetical protein
MADLKISQLPAATVPLAGTEVLPIVQSGSTVQVSVDNVIASRASLGANTFTAAQEWATGAAVASASTINLNTTTGNRVHITGTTAITTVTLTRGPRTVIFDGVLTLTHNATTNNLPGATNITTAAGDRAIYESDGTTVYCVSYIKASGLAVLNPVATATTSGLVPTPPNDATKVLSGAMTYITPAASALVFLSSVTASASATVDIESTFNSTYDAYLIVITGLIPGTNNTQLNIRMKIGGSYIATATYYDHVSQPTSAATTYVGTRDNGSADINLQNSLSSDPGDNANFTYTIVNPTSTSLKKTLYFAGNSVKGTELTSFTGAAMNTGTSALTGVRFFMSSGNIASGIFRLYGIANS